jgi:tetratricopeptide (TPR) repeat protein
MGACEIVTARWVSIVLALLLTSPWLFAADTNAVNMAAEFERANKLYEQGKYAEAAAAYENLARAGGQSSSVWFNLGNAAYKSGQIGGALTAYRMAERRDPRDTALRANLQFVRTKVYTDERTRLPGWIDLVRIATLNEWTVLSASLLWMFFAILACGELARKHYSKTAVAFLILFALSVVALGLALRDQIASHAIVIAKEATARLGPVDDSQAVFQLRDGAELAVLGLKGEWFEVRDAEKRVGWVRADAVALLPSIRLSWGRSQ